MLASQQAHVVEGMLMLLAYSLGLGIPFVFKHPSYSYNNMGNQNNQNSRRNIF